MCINSKNWKKEDKIYCVDNSTFVCVQNSNLRVNGKNGKLESKISHQTTMTRNA